MGATIIIETAAVHTYQRRFTTTELAAAVSHANLYLISRRPRTTATFVLPDQLLVAVEGEHVTLPVPEGLLNHMAGTSFTDDGSYFQMPLGDDVLHGESWALATALSGGDERFNLHEVLYIGRGDDAGRRLGAHKTLQRILEDHAASDWDIFVTPLTIDNTSTMFADHLDDDIQDGDGAVLDFDALTTALQARGGGKASTAAINIAEHAMISYFSPAYNTLLKAWNASYSHKTDEMELLWRAGAHLCLTICQGRWEMASFFTEKQPPARSHAIASEVPTAVGASGFGSIPFSDVQVPVALESVKLLQGSTGALMRDYEVSDFILNVFGQPPASGMPAPSGWVAWRTIGRAARV